MEAGYVAVSAAPIVMVTSNCRVLVRDGAVLARPVVEVTAYESIAEYGGVAAALQLLLGIGVRSSVNGAGAG